MPGCSGELPLAATAATAAAMAAAAGVGPPPRARSLAISLASSSSRRAVWRGSGTARVTVIPVGLPTSGRLVVVMNGGTWPAVDEAGVMVPTLGNRSATVVTPPPLPPPLPPLAAARWAAAAAAPVAGGNMFNLRCLRRLFLDLPGISACVIYTVQ